MSDKPVSVVVFSHEVHDIDRLANRVKLAMRPCDKDFRIVASSQREAEVVGPMTKALEVQIRAKLGMRDAVE